MIIGAISPRVCIVGHTGGRSGPCGRSAGRDGDGSLLVAQSAAASALCEHFFLRQEIAGDFTLTCHQSQPPQRVVGMQRTDRTAGRCLISEPDSIPVQSGVGSRIGTPPRLSANFLRTHNAIILGPARARYT